MTSLASSLVGRRSCGMEQLCTKTLPVSSDEMIKNWLSYLQMTSKCYTVYQSPSSKTYRPQFNLFKRRIANAPDLFLSSFLFLRMVQMETMFSFQSITLGFLITYDPLSLARLLLIQLSSSKVCSRVVDLGYILKRCRSPLLADMTRCLWRAIIVCRFFKSEAGVGAIV